MPRMDQLSTYRTATICTNGRISVIYVATEVVTVTPDGTITLRTGGYRSVTTKRKMNQASNQFGLGYGVTQRKGDWLVTFRDGRADMAFAGDEITFPRYADDATPTREDRMRDQIANGQDIEYGDAS